MARDTEREDLADWSKETAAEMRLFQRLKKQFPEEDAAELAALLGLEYRPPRHRPDEEQQIPPLRFKPSPTAQPSPQGAYPDEIEDLPFLFLSRRVARASRPEGSQLPAWYREIEPFPGQFDTSMQPLPSPEPLCAWEHFWPRVYRLLGEEGRTRRLDLPRIIRQAVRQRPLRSLPLKKRRRWPTEIVLVVDFSPRLSPYFEDFKALAGQMIRWFHQRLRLITCVDTGLPHYREGGRVYHRFPKVSRDAHLLYLGDLGVLDRHGFSDVRWRRIGQALCRQGIRLEAFLTLSKQDFARVLARDFHLHPLEPGGQSHPVPRSDEAVETLLAWLSPAMELSVPLIRAARRELGLPVSAESLLCQHPALQGHARIFQWRDRTWREHYRHAFRQHGFELAAVWPLIEQLESTLPEEMQVEQRQQAGRPLSRTQRRAIRRLVKWQHAGELSEENQAILFEWIESVVERSADEPWDEEMAKLFGLYWRWQPEHRRCPPPVGVDLSQMPAWITGTMPSRSLDIVLTRDRLHIRQTDAGVEEKGWVLAQCELTGQGEIELRTETGVNKQALTANSTIANPERLQSLVIRTPQEELTLANITRPPWGTGIGRDRHGLFVEVEVKGVPFVLRWIPPGEFMMGSPPDEPGRFDDEGPQHRVRFARGFWLAETACTQALWQAVIGENPSLFKGEENPVESVSWEDAKRFIEKINRLHPGLELRLPSESEWEYACRAGTTTPYWFGSELTTDKANYDGNHPYAGGPKGEYREKTVPVRHFQPNPWGLYQMHGNVWEWCEDAWHDSYEGAPADGQPWKTSGEQERAVLRGGSWIRRGRYLRSASRGRDHRDSRNDINGFRLARGPELKPAQPGGAGGASGQPERKK